MRIEIATHAAFFLLPAVQWHPTWIAFGQVWPWQVVIWWGNRGIQFSGIPQRR